MIYTSTGGVHDKPAWDTCKKYLETGINNIELSGGIYDSRMLSMLNQLILSANFQIHNYFPPPKHPFVFNLASLNKDTSKLSINHTIKAIQLATDIGQSVYSFHAGYLLDPNVNELGKKIYKRKIYERDISINVFLEIVNKLAVTASRYGVELLIENNVLSMNNYNEFGLNPFIMVDPNECVYVMKNTPDNVNMLVDVAHLKVSSNSLNYNPVDMFLLCEPWIKAYHFSDNNGLSDTNDIFDGKAWFWPYIKNNIDYYCIEVYDASLKKLRELVDLVMKKVNNI